MLFRNQNLANRNPLLVSMVFANANTNALISVMLNFASDLSDPPTEDETPLSALRFFVPYIISQEDCNSYF